MSVRVLGATLKGSAGTFAHGLEWCLDNGVTVANLSLSTTNETWVETFHELVDTASFRRMMLVSAMSNERKRTIPSEFAVCSRWRADLTATKSGSGATHTDPPSGRRRR